MDKFTHYWSLFETWLQSLSNGEAAFYVGIIPSAVIWFVAQIFKKRSKKAADQPSSSVQKHPPAQKVQNHAGSGDNTGRDKITAETVNIHHHAQPVTGKNQSQPTPEKIKENPKIQITRLPTTNNKLIGRKSELSQLNQAWQNPKTNIFILKAIGGTGKTALMQTWLNQLLTRDEHNAQAIYTWSFYSQGSAEDKQASADDFFDATLKWFAYNGEPISNAHDKGIKLAELMLQQRTLLLLDGLEPLQYPSGSAMNGELRDQGLVALFRQLAAINNQHNGLLLISSRQDITELQALPQPQVIHQPLAPLSRDEGIQLFKATNIIGTDKELASAVKEVHGHALSLNLLAKYLNDYENSDIKCRSNLHALTDFPEATRDSEHAFKVMAAYEKQLHGTNDLQLLYILGLFDRPVSLTAIDTLRKTDIAHISSSNRQNAINDKVLHAVIQRLRQQQLLNSPVNDENKCDNNQSDKPTTNPIQNSRQNHNNAYSNPGQNPQTLDCHPLVRQYFANRLKTRYPQSWQQANQQLYEYYKALPDKQQPDTLDEMEPLFAAITHGCAAGLHQTALDEVYWPRILREDDHYIAKKLGAFGADLAALSHFFNVEGGSGWQTPAAGLTDDDKAAVLNWAAFRLRALGRLQEAVQPMQASIDLAIKQNNWENAASAASSLSELQLTRGVLIDKSGEPQQGAIKAAQQSVQLADDSGDAFMRLYNRATLADAQHQAGELDTSRALFAEAETVQQERQPDYPLLYSLQGFRYCDLLLTVGEWRQVQERAEQIKVWSETVFTRPDILGDALNLLSLGRASLQQTIRRVRETHHQTSTTHEPLKDAPIEHLVITLPCSVTDVQQTPTEESQATTVRSTHTTEYWLNQAVDGLRKTEMQYLPLGLLARASYHRILLAGTDLTQTKPTTDNNPNYQQALNDLTETQQIAQRGGMLLHLTDYHLEASRLALTTQQNIHDLTAQQHLDEAIKLIESTGYKRRLPEVEFLKDHLRLHS